MSAFLPNPLLEKQLEAQIKALGTLRPAAQKAAARAETFTHHAMPRSAAQRVVVGVVDGEVAVINTNFGGHLEEWGLARTPVYAPLRRGVRAAGLKLRES
jgi:hypothetical protein